MLLYGKLDTWLSVLLTTAYSRQFFRALQTSKDTLDSNSTSTDHDPDRLFKRDRKFEETQDDSEENIWEKYVEIPAFPWKYSAPIKNREGINIL